MYHDLLSARISHVRHHFFVAKKCCRNTDPGRLQGKSSVQRKELSVGHEHD